MSAVYIYIRYSRAEQKDGDSYGRQLNKAKDYCAKNNYTFREENIYFDDGVSTDSYQKFSRIDFNYQFDYTGNANIDAI